jgi:beta-lactamase superfamily II metal-dependent hydrolase
MRSVAAECYFLDVGQGASAAIDLGDGSAIVIDCGASSKSLQELLRIRLGISRIAVLVLTHNHFDHIGGTPNIVSEYRRMIDRVCLLQDRRAADMESQRVISFLAQEQRLNNIPDPTPLIRSDCTRTLYPLNGKVAAGGVSLEILFPSFFQNIHGQSSGNPNETSSVLLLRCGNRSILFSGDAELDAWKSINKERSRPIECDVITVPHHGGHLAPHADVGEDGPALHQAVLSDLNWLYRECIHCKYAIVSVGTSNSYPHPIPEHVEAICGAGYDVICTQITRRCHDDLESLRPGVLLPLKHPGHSQPTKTVTAKNESRNVACAGTVLVQIGPDLLNVERFSEFRSAVDTKISPPAGHPHCRRVPEDVVSEPAA